MGKTRRYKKRRKNSRRYKQKRCKTTRKRKRKHRRTKKQKGGLCCKYENDWTVERRLQSGVNKGHMVIENKNGKWRAANGCGKGYGWGPGNPESNAPPFVLPDWHMKVNEPDDEYYGYKFGMLKYTPVQIPENSFDPIDGIKIGLFAHSLKHMEALGIKCYDIPAFTSVIKEITQKGQWYYMTDADPNAPKTKYTVFREGWLKDNAAKIQEMQRKMENRVKRSKRGRNGIDEEELEELRRTLREKLVKKAWMETNYWDGKKLTPVIYTRSEELLKKQNNIRQKRKLPENRVFTNFSDFFNNITYSKNKHHNVSQTRHGLRTCSCMYVLNEPISFTDENSNKWSQKTDDVGSPKVQELEGYNIIAVNLIFAKFVTKRIDGNKMVLNEIENDNKYTLFLLAIEVLNEESLFNWCAHNSSTPKANSTAKNKNLSLNNISDCIGVTRKGWYLTRNNAADYSNMGTVKALSLDNMKEKDWGYSQIKQNTLIEKFVLNYLNKRQILDDIGKATNMETSPFSKQVNKTKKDMLKAFEEVPRPQFTPGSRIPLDASAHGLITFVEKAKTFNYKLRLFINDVTDLLKSKQKEVGFAGRDEHGNLPKNLKKEQQVMGAVRNIVRHSQDIHPQTNKLRQLSTESVLPPKSSPLPTAPAMLRNASSDNFLPPASPPPPPPPALLLIKEAFRRRRMQQLINHQSMLADDEVRQLGLQEPSSQIAMLFDEESGRGVKRERERNKIVKKKDTNIRNFERANQKVIDDNRLYPNQMKIIKKLQTIVKALRGQYIDFYVEREVCQAPDAIDRERIDKQLHNAIFTLDPYYNFVTINSEPFEIKFNSPPSWWTHAQTARQEDPQNFLHLSRIAETRSS